MSTSNKVSRTINDKTFAAVKAFANNQRLADGNKTTAVDLLIAAGFNKASDFISPNGKKKSESTSSPVEYGRIKEAVLAGFTAKQRNLYNAANAKGLSDQDKFLRRETMQKVGAYIAALGKAVGKKEQGSNPRPPADNSPAGKLTRVLTQIQKMESPDFNVTEAVKQLKALIKLVK